MSVEVKEGGGARHIEAQIPDLAGWIPAL